MGAGVFARYNHSNDCLLGSTQADTLRLPIDSVGLDYSVDLPEYRADVFELVSRGDVTQSSFAFAVGVGGDEWGDSDGMAQRTLITGEVFDVAPVGGALAAYPDATVALRSLGRAKDIAEEDVLNLAAKDQLQRLFGRSDRPTLARTPGQHRGSDASSRSPALLGVPARRPRSHAADGAPAPQTHPRRLVKTPAPQPQPKKRTVTTLRARMLVTIRGMFYNIEAGAQTRRHLVITICGTTSRRC
jgi:hypothetical protein